MDRAHRSLWALTAVTVLATGLFAQALAAAPGPGADARAVAGAVLLTASATLLIRVMRYLTQGAPVRQEARLSDATPGDPSGAQQEDRDAPSDDGGR